MIEIDGSIGGGQILRTAVGISALILEPCRIINIRRARPKPGLRPQHLWGVKIAGQLCKAEVNGLEVGSENIEFVPKEHCFADKEVDIGTSGSLQLLMQSLMPALVFSDATLNAKGGTAGLGAPTAEYTKCVTMPAIEKLTGSRPDLVIQKQGFYPKGGGHIVARFHSAKHLKQLKNTKRGQLKKITGVSVAGKIPEEVAQRQALAARKVLSENGFEVDIEVEHADTFSPGTSITLVADCENTILGSDGVGQRRKRAETVGNEAANSLLKSIRSNAVFDRYMSDQIVPFIALARGNSTVSVEEITEHTRSNIMVTQKMLGVEFDIDEAENIISVEGIGFSR